MKLDLLGICAAVEVCLQRVCFQVSGLSVILLKIVNPKHQVNPEGV